MLTRKDLEAAWRNTPRKEPPTSKELQKALQVLSDSSSEWDKRVQQLKVLRTLSLSPDDSLAKTILPFIDPLELALRDLRSQVSKEASLTISFLVAKFKMQMSQLAEKCLATAITQCSCSTVKVISLHSARLSEVLVEEVQSGSMYLTLSSFSCSKDKGQRKQAAILLGTVISMWEPKLLKKVMPSVYIVIDAFISDADGDTRAAARMAFEVLEEKYPEYGSKCFDLLQPKKQRLLRASSTSGLYRDAKKPEVSSEPTKKRRSLMAPESSELGFAMLGELSIGAFGSPNITRVKSNLGPNSFCATLSAEQATKLETQMREAGKSLSETTGTDDDDFLLSKPVVSPTSEPPKTSPKNSKEASPTAASGQETPTSKRVPQLLSSRRSSPMLVSPAPLAASSPTWRETSLLSSDLLSKEATPTSPEGHKNNEISVRIVESLEKMKNEPLVGIVELQTLLREKSFPFDSHIFDAIHLSMMNQFTEERSEECKQAALGFIRKVCMLRSMALSDKVSTTVTTIMRMADSETSNADTKKKAAEILMMLASHLMGSELIDVLNDEMSKSKIRERLVREMIAEIKDKLEPFELEEFIILTKNFNLNDDTSEPSECEDSR